MNGTTAQRTATKKKEPFVLNAITKSRGVLVEPEASGIPFYLKGSSRAWHLEVTPGGGLQLK